ncbi:endo alpha-1,4 polygalactosaminidase [Aeromicrobium wangtongii]|uniref:Endo alpha-1,4 polygalactosaminidase n=1 Tax=Aeromicrobium wangtongii TaxID=2969247 RepID=A0ABY5MC99_9ACTN|nr:endo alpha-1,4 polygalactosaminidase [Aeromicrobium wangtongii]MCD9197107.1 endo alpha-1,4 polygalactosaminidase [Aeromicrobium wangtongii]UUP14605.1 endo alpha-1,4 polygalactosaminidase [Aeromicrobium wangtongii]
MIAPLASLLAAVAVTAAPITLPPTAGVADYQLGGAYPPAANVQIVTRDRSAAPAPGRYSICYVNSFQTQPGTLRWWKKKHPSLLLRDAKGRLVRDPGWRDEVLLDIRTAKKRAALGAINRAWFAQCARKGYRAIEPDNLDSWTRSKGRLKKTHAVSFAKRLVREAHGVNLAIAQKNAPQLSRLRLGFDFAVAEECEVYRECGTYRRYYGTRLIEIEYTDNGRSAFRQACAARGGSASILLRDRGVVRPSSRRYVFEAC